MSDQLKFRLAAGVGLSLVVVLAAFVWERDREREKKVEYALAQAAKDREVATRIERLEERRAWEKVEEAAEALNDPGLKDDARVAAFARFRQELQRFKSRHGYPQLGAGR
jgi:hypothetical protein